jgi:hypothetical protein
MWSSRLPKRFRKLFDIRVGIDGSVANSAPPWSQTTAEVTTSHTTSTVMPGSPIDWPPRPNPTVKTHSDSEAEPKP